MSFDMVLIKVIIQTVLYCTSLGHQYDLIVSVNRNSSKALAK